MKPTQYLVSLFFVNTEGEIDETQTEYFMKKEEAEAYFEEVKEEILSGEQDAVGFLSFSVVTREVQVYGNTVHTVEFKEDKDDDPN